MTNLLVSCSRSHYRAICLLLLAGLLILIAFVPQEAAAQSSPKKSTLEVRHFSDAEKRRPEWNDLQEAFFRKYLYIPTYDSWVEQDRSEVYRPVNRYFKRETEDGIFRPVFDFVGSDFSVDIRQVFASLAPQGAFSSEQASKQAHAVAWDRFRQQMIEECAKPKSREEQAAGAPEVFERETAKIKEWVPGTWSVDGAVALYAMKERDYHLFGIDEDRNLHPLKGLIREPAEYRLKYNGVQRIIATAKTEGRKMGRPFFVQVRLINDHEFARNNAVLKFQVMMLDDDGFYKAVSEEIQCYVTDLSGQLTLKDKNKSKDDQSNYEIIKGYEKAVFSKRDVIVKVTQAVQDVIKPEISSLTICPNPDACGGGAFAVSSSTNPELRAASGWTKGEPEFRHPLTSAQRKLWWKVTEPVVRNLKRRKPYQPLVGDESQVATEIKK